MQKCVAVRQRVKNGSWIRKGSPTAYVSVHENHGSVTIYRCSKMGDFSHHFKISCTYCHSASPDFYRTITMAYGMLNFKSIIFYSTRAIQQLAFVQYGFDRYEHPVKICSHGNTKVNTKSYNHTMPSTIQMK